MAVVRRLHELPRSGETDLDGLVPLFRRLAHVEYGLVILTVKGTNDFVQYSGGAGGIQLDLPLVTKYQQRHEAEIHGFFARQGERVVERRGTDGARFFEVDLPADPDRIARLTAGVVRELFGASREVKLVVQSDGLPPA